MDAEQIFVNIHSVVMAAVTLAAHRFNNLSPPLPPLSPPTSLWLVIKDRDLELSRNKGEKEPV